MTIPSIQELELAAKNLVQKAQKEDSLHEVSQRIIREMVEKQFSLNPGALEASEYKHAIKAAVVAAVKAATDEDASKLKAKQTSTKTSPSKTRKSTVKKKSNKKAKAEGEEESDSDQEATPKNKGKGKGKRVIQDSEYSEEDVPSPKKKPKVASKPKSAQKPKLGSEEDGDEPDKRPKPTEKAKSKKIESDDEDGEESKSKSPSSKKKGSKEFKSLEHVPTSDMDEDEPMPNQPSTSKAAPKSPKTAKTQSDDTPKKKAAPKASSSKPMKVQSPEPDAKSDSELSVLIDEPPKKKRKSASEKKSTKAKEKKSAKSSSTLSKDEETIKRLKALVVACGTRKVWSKVFQDLDTPQLQIKKLKEILAELGMTGRLSMEQAKAIKEKKELAQELEDVTEFAKKVASRPTTTRRETANKSSVGADESESEKESDKNEDPDDEEVAAPRKRMNARKSIMAFLEDQSDEE